MPEYPLLYGFLFGLEFLQARDVLAEYVKLDVHHCAGGDVLEVSMVVCVWNNGNFKRIIGWVANR